MRILIAPDKFKGSLAAADVAAAIAAGIRQILPRADISLCPLADGGEGTVPAMLAATSGRLLRQVVVGPLPQMSLQAEYGILGDNQTAVIEMASASGLVLLSDAQRNPFNTTTYGTGQLIRAAATAGCQRIILGIGGSATVDGGIGALQALGLTFHMADGSTHGPSDPPLVGSDLRNIVKVAKPTAWNLPEILIACDVENPLCGPDGAAEVFGPQKGATPQQVQMLDQWLGAFARTTQTTDLANRPGSGAAGGLGYGLCALIPHTRMAGGFDLVANACNFASRLRNVDLCLTGEGRFDQSSLKGKTAIGVVRACQAAGVKCVVLAGSVEPAAAQLLGDTPVLSICNGPISLDEAMKRAADLLKNTAFQVMRLVGQG